MTYDRGPLIMDSFGIQSVGIYANNFEHLLVEADSDIKFVALSNHPPKRYAG
jgi:hypothetical protein